MKIAVVIPVYNVAPYLRRCLDSVVVSAREVEKRGGGGQRMDRSSVEIVCVDDGSTDGSGEILDAYALNPQPSTPNPQPTLRILRQPNGGLSAARNAALDLLARERTATHVTFVDADDWVAPSYLAELARGLENGAEVSSVRFLRMSEEGDFPSAVAAAEWRTVSPRAFWLLAESCPASACGKLYALRLFDGIRYPVGKVSEDELTTYRICFGTSRVAYAEAPLYAYFTRPGSIMNAAWSPRRMDRLQAWRDQMRFFGSLGYDELVANSRKGLVGDLTEAVRNLRRLGDAGRAEECRRELAEQLEAGRLSVRDHYLAHKTAHPLRTRFMKLLRRG